ncbi:MAG: helix-turn-helix transcriptional regulator [Opitutaceae bacterium]|nr:helix-turn-helix transcriptional regulator [Opitutaceae bacterium]
MASKSSHSSDRKNVVGERIRAVRLSSRPAVTQTALSARLATAGITIDQSAIARIESGSRGISDVEVIAIARALRVGVNELFPKD